MGLLDSVAGAVLGKVLGDKAGLAQVALDMFSNNGGLGGVLDKFKNAGLADEVASWVGKGENLPISADKIKEVLGSGMVADMAAKFGISADDLSAKMAEYLPQMIDKATPDGEVNDKSGDLLSSVLGMLK